MDERLAVEAEIAALLAFGPEARLVADRVVDAVEDVEAVGARRRDRRGEVRQDRPAAGHLAGTRILGDVVGAHDEAIEPGDAVAGDAGDALAMEDGEGRLDHRPDAQGLGRADAAQAVAERGQRFRVRHLRHEHGVGAGLGRGGDVVLAPGRVGPVDPDHDLATAEAAFADRRRNLQRARRPWPRARLRPPGR